MKDTLVMAFAGGIALVCFVALLAIGIFTIWTSFVGFCVFFGLTISFMSALKALAFFVVLPAVLTVCMQVAIMATGLTATNAAVKRIRW